MKMIDIKVAIQKAFQKIGKSNGHAPPDPPPASNTFPIAYEFFVADNLRSLANKRYEAAKEAAQKAGVLGDEAEYQEGSTITTFNSDLFDVAAKKARGSRTLDKTELSNYLNRKGWKQAEIDELLVKGSKPRKGAVTFEVVLKG